MQPISSGLVGSELGLSDKPDQFQASDFSFYQRKPAKAASQATFNFMSPPPHEQASSSRPLVKLPDAPQLPIRKSLTPLPSIARHPVPQAQSASAADQQKPLRMRPGPAACPAWKRVVRDPPLTSAAKQAPSLVSRLANLVRAPVLYSPAAQADSTHVAGVRPAHYCTHPTSCDKVTAADKDSCTAAVGRTESSSPPQLPYQPAASPAPYPAPNQQQSSTSAPAASASVTATAAAAAAAATGDHTAHASLPGGDAATASHQSPASGNSDRQQSEQAQHPAQPSVSSLPDPLETCAILPAQPASAMKSGTGSRSRLRLHRPPIASLSSTVTDLGQSAERMQQPFVSSHNAGAPPQKGTRQLQDSMLPADVHTSSEAAASQTQLASGSLQPSLVQSSVAAAQSAVPRMAVSHHSLKHAAQAKGFVRPGVGCSKDLGQSAAQRRDSFSESEEEEEQCAALSSSEEEEAEAEAGNHLDKTAWDGGFDTPRVPSHMSRKPTAAGLMARQAGSTAKGKQKSAAASSRRMKSLYSDVDQDSDAQFEFTPEQREAQLRWEEEDAEDRAVFPDIIGSLSKCKAKHQPGILSQPGSAPTSRLAVSSSASAASSTQQLDSLPLSTSRLAFSSSPALRAHKPAPAPSHSRFKPVQASGQPGSVPARSVHKQVASIDSSLCQSIGVGAHDSNQNSSAAGGHALIFDIDDDVGAPAEAAAPSHAQNATPASSDMQQDTGLLFDIDDGPVQPAGVRQQAAHISAASQDQPSLHQRQDAAQAKADSHQDNGLLVDIDDGPVQQPSTNQGSVGPAPASQHQQPSLGAVQLHNGPRGCAHPPRSGLTNEPCQKGQEGLQPCPPDALNFDIDDEPAPATKHTAGPSQAAAIQHSMTPVTADRRNCSLGALSTQAPVQRPADPKPVLPAKRPAASGELQRSHQQQWQQHMPKAGPVRPAGPGAFKAPRRIVPPVQPSSADSPTAAEGAAEAAVKPFKRLRKVGQAPPNPRLDNRAAAVHSRPAPASRLSTASRQHSSASLYPNADDGVDEEEDDDASLQAALASSSQQQQQRQTSWSKQSLPKPLHRSPPQSESTNHLSAQDEDDYPDVSKRQQPSTLSCLRLSNQGFSSAQNHAAAAAASADAHHRYADDDDYSMHDAVDTHMEDDDMTDDREASIRAGNAALGKSGFAGFNTASNLLQQQQADARQAKSSMLQSSNPFARAKSQSDKTKQSSIALPRSLQTSAGPSRDYSDALKAITQTPTDVAGKRRQHRLTQQAQRAQHGQYGDAETGAGDQQEVIDLVGSPHPPGSRAVALGHGQAIVIEEEDEQDRVPSEGPPWWHRFPDFVPLSALQLGTNPRDGAQVHIDYKSQFSDQRRKRKAKSKVQKASRATAPAAAAEPIDLDDFGEAEGRWNYSAAAGPSHTAGNNDDMPSSQDATESSEDDGDDSQQQRYSSCWQTGGHQKAYIDAGGRKLYGKQAWATARQEKGQSTPRSSANKKSGRKGKGRLKAKASKRPKFKAARGRWK